MKNKLNKQIKQKNITLDHPQIKVRLDHRTFIKLPRIESLAAWIKRYPDAVVISS